TPSPTHTLPPAEPADIIFHTGEIITIEETQPLAEAIAIRNGLIQAVGTNEEVLALQGAGTQVIDLQGRTMMPGFIDGHTHILAFPDRMGRSLDEAQETALRYGFTTVNEMWADEGYLSRLMQAEQEGSLQLRVNVFASYNDGILDDNRRRVMLETWYPEHAPILDPERFLRIPGIKIFMDGDNWTPARGCWALSDPFMPNAPALTSGVCGSDRGDLYWSQEELNQAVLQAQTAGYRVAFHAMGDGAIETALNAIEYALAGQPNENYRHQIEHNSLARPDQVPRYEALDVLASVRGYGGFCDLSFLLPTFGPDRQAWYANRYALAGSDIHAYIETDFGWTVDPDDRFSQRSLDPIMQLFGIVTHRYVAEDGSICEPDPLVAAFAISVERALQMLTIEPAYAVSMEDYIGSLEPGKYADLILLSGNPLSVNPDEIMDLQVWMTMVAGEVKYCAAGHETLCP
ncbi:MAG: amidohydrolase family protein, partial [Chloroflexota bacterium]